MKKTCLIQFKSLTDLHIVNTIDKKSSQNSGFDPGTVPIAPVYAFSQEGLSSLLCFSIVDLKCAWMIADCVVDGYTAMFENMLLNNKLITGKSNIHRHILPSYTGCSLNIVFFTKILDYSGLLPFSVFSHTRQVEHQRCSRTGRVQKNHKILRKNTIFNEHPVSEGRDTMMEDSKNLLYI